MTNEAGDWIEFRLQKLRFDRFEELVCDLLRAKGHKEIRHWGAKGSEGGYDVLSVSPEGQRWATQCKRVASLSKSEAQKELEKMIERAPDPPPVVVHLAATCAISRAVDEAWKSTAETAKLGLEVASPWAIDTLVAALLDDESLRRRYVGRSQEVRAPFWNVPERNPFFTGRTELIDQLGQEFREHQSVGLTRAIVGLGGIGKTQIAIECAHRYRGSYYDVFWVNASSRSELESDLARLAVELGWSVKEVSIEDGARVFVRRIQDLERWLLILDNADHPEELPRLPRGKGHTLITSRQRNLVRLGVKSPLDVGVLGLEEAKALVLDRSGRSEKQGEAASRLAEALGFLPLALEQAGAYLAEVRMGINEYLADFERRRLVVVELAKPETGEYEHTVASTWSMSFEKVRETSPAAADALQLMSLLDPEGIPLELFEEGGRVLGPAIGELVERLASEPGIIRAEVVRVLERYSMARFDPEDSNLSLHRLVQTVLRESLSRETLASTWRSAHEGLNGLFPKQQSTPEIWSRSERLKGSMIALFDHWSEVKDSLSDFDPTGLWIWLGIYSKERGDYGSAERVERQALEVSRHVLGEKHPDTLNSMNNLATTLWAIGDADGARKLLEQTFEAYSRTRGEEHSDTLRSMSNLALTQWAQGDADGARQLLEKALERSRRMLGGEHTDTLSLMNNLATVRWEQGDADSARQLLEKALAIYRQTLGEEHPDTLRAMNNLAATLRALGDAEGARQLNETALERSRRMLGRMHPDTLSSMNNLAATLRSLGDLNRARKLVEKAVAVYHQVLGEEHPDTLSSMSNLGATLRALGDLDRARELLEKVVTVCRHTLGGEHPDTLRSTNNLAATLRALGDVDGARQLLESTLEKNRKVLGETHPDTLSSMNNLAVVLRDQGNVDDARELLEKTLSVFRQMLGEEHPDTLSSKNDLAVTLREQGDLEGARQLNEQALDGRRRVLGKEHPDTLTSMNNLAATLCLQEDMDGARQLDEQALDGRRRVLGEEHPDTLTSMNDLAEILRNQGDTDSARQLLEQALDGRRRVLGEEHPDTLTSASNMAETLRAQGDAEGARLLYEKALQGLQTVLGEEHPDTRTVARDLAVLLGQE